MVSDINIEEGEIEILTKSNKKDQKGRLKLVEGKNKLEILIKTIPIESTKIQLTIEDQFGSAKKIEIDIKDLCEIKKTEQKIINKNQNKDKIQSTIESEREIIKSLTKKRKKILRNNKLTNPDLLLEEIANEKKELISLQKKRKKLIQNSEAIDNLNTANIDNDIKNVSDELKKLEKKIVTNPNGILESCIQKNDLERLQKILSENEYDLNNKNGANLLYSAYKNKNIEALKTLLEQNIESYKNKDNKTLLHLAAEGGEIEILNILLDKTDNKNPKDKEDKTPFDLAIQNERESAIKILAKWNKENIKKL